MALHLSAEPTRLSLPPNPQFLSLLSPLAFTPGTERPRPLNSELPAQHTVL